MRVPEAPRRASDRPKIPVSDTGMGGHEGGTMTRILARNQAQLARVLGVWPSAVGKARRDGRIPCGADGTWDVVEVARVWRSATNPFSLGPWARDRPWLDPRVTWTDKVEAQLV